MEVCADLIANRGLINLLFSPVATDSFLSSGLGLGRTVHGQAPNEGEVNRKGISCERTFAAISSAADLEAKVGLSAPGSPALVHSMGTVHVCKHRQACWASSRVWQQPTVIGPCMQNHSIARSCSDFYIHTCSTA